MNHHRNNKPPASLRRWANLLDSRLPIVGEMLRGLAADNLIKMARSGNAEACLTLARAFGGLSAAEQRKILTGLNGPQSQSCLDALWGGWFEKRAAGLVPLLSGYSRPAVNPAIVRAASLLVLNRIEVIAKATPEVVTAMVNLCSDADMQLAQAARQVLPNFTSPEAVNTLVSLWETRRTEIIENAVQTGNLLTRAAGSSRVFLALKWNQPDCLLSEPDVFAPLWRASQDADAIIARRAVQCLSQLQHDSAITQLCQAWLDTRRPLLEQTLLQAHYLPTSPPVLRLLVALKTDRMETARQIPPSLVVELLQAAQDPDPVIQLNASRAAVELIHPLTQDALCQRFLQNDDALAGKFALQGGYTPAKPEDRALFLFLTEQWTNYEALDFDRRLMRTVYTTATASLRQRISRQVQQAGKTDYLTIINRVDLSGEIAHLDPTEADLLVQVLQSNREYARLWRLAAELTPERSRMVIQHLVQNAWRPEDPGEQADFAHLVDFATRPMLFSVRPGVDMAPALARSLLRVPGRANDVAFAPDKPILAIGTGSRKVALWDYGKGQMAQVVRGFAHSVGEVAFTPAGTLICGERTNGNNPCNIYTWAGSELQMLGSHQRTITVLETSLGDKLWSAGRDNVMMQWDTFGRRLVQQTSLTQWPRTACVSSSGQHLAAASRQIEVYSVQPFNRLLRIAIRSRTNGPQLSMARNLCFTPNENGLILGQSNGQVIEFGGLFTKEKKSGSPAISQRLITTHTGAVEGLIFHPLLPYLITAGRDGELRFFHWSERREQIGFARSATSAFTSLQISPDGSFLATGSSDASLILWDLRPLQLEQWLTQPLSKSSPHLLANLNALAEVPEFPQQVQAALQFVRAMLQLRYRYDIQIDEPATLQAGEFDVIVDEK